jgi:hypothetical protein
MAQSDSLQKGRKYGSLNIECFLAELLSHPLQDVGSNSVCIPMVPAYLLSRLVERDMEVDGGDALSPASRRGKCWVPRSHVRRHDLERIVVFE